MSNQVKKDSHEWNRHRVVCWVVRWVVNSCGDMLCENTRDRLMDYLVDLLEYGDLETVKWTVLAVERLCLKMQLCSSKINLLRTSLTRHSAYIDTVSLVSAPDLGHFDSLRYQVGWCARWCCDNMLVEIMEVEEVPEIKLSNDRFEARCENNYDGVFPQNYFSIRSSFIVKSSVYFYEIIFVKNGNIRIGWSTRDGKLSALSAIGDDEHSIGLSVGNECYIWHNKQQHAISTTPSFCTFNVVGCLIDVDNKQFEFFINGREIECSAKIHFSSQPYFATATFLSSQQHCYFNFGQSPFKYPPQNSKFQNFSQASEKNEIRYRLIEPNDYGTRFWFKHIVTNNKVNRFYCDVIQNKFDMLVKKVEDNIKNDQDIEKLRLENVKIEKRWIGVRYIQSIIESMGKMIEVEKVDLMAQWIGLVIEDAIDEVCKGELLELLYPYLQLRVRAQFDANKHRSICIVLLHLIKCCRHHSYTVIKHVHSEILSYLIRTLVETSDEWTKLFVLLALEDLEMNEQEKMNINADQKFGSLIDELKLWSEGKNVYESLNLGIYERINYQLFLCSQHVFTTVLAVHPRAPQHSNVSQATLNPEDRSIHLKLSPCQFFARSDWQWQSLRSVCQVRAKTYYFEVVLLTAGPMAIGWATKRTDLNKISKIHSKTNQQLMIGFDEFSIVFDGYNRCIYHNNKTFQLENIPRWKSGDIIGCLIDISKKCIKFYLNSIKINFNSDIHISSQHYFALISLSQFQQCYCNFGQVPFSLQPNHINFHDLSSILFNNELVRISRKENNSQISNLTENAFSNDSNNERNDFIFGNITYIKSINCKIENLNDVKLENSNLNKNVVLIGSKVKQRDLTITDGISLKNYVDLNDHNLDENNHLIKDCQMSREMSDSIIDESITENQSNESKYHLCSICDKYNAVFCFISCSPVHFKFCQSCIKEIKFKNCPKCDRKLG